MPAKIIGYRFEEKYRNALLDVKWWNWPLPVIKEHMNMLMDSDVDDETIRKLYEITVSVQFSHLV